VELWRLDCSLRGSRSSENIDARLRAIIGKRERCLSLPSGFIEDREIPAAIPLMAHALETYAGETNKTASVFREFDKNDLTFRPHPRSSTVLEIMKHELLSERRFFAEFLGVPEPDPSEVLPREESPEAFAARLLELARPRLTFLAEADETWWLGICEFFDVRRQRVWILWRRILHSAHHRTQLTVYLRLMDKKVPAVYGPSADVSWAGASPTLTVEDAGAR
jgi:uncharacterized damage-inducible protein DinB